MEISHWKITILRIVVWILFASAATYMYFHGTRLNTDTLFYQALYHGLTHGIGWKLWRFPAAPSYFPDIFLFFIIASITTHMKLRIYLLALVQIILLIVSGIYLLRNLITKNSWLGEIFLIALLSYINTALPDHRLSLYVNQQNIHMSTTFLMIFALVFLLKYLFSSYHRILYLSLLFAVCLTQLVSDYYFIITFFLTASVLMFFYYIHQIASQSQVQKKRALIILLILFVSLFVSRMIVALINFNQPFSYRAPITPDKAGKSLQYFMAGHIHILTSGEWPIYLLLAVFLVGLGYAIYYIYPKYQKNQLGWPLEKLTNEHLFLSFTIIFFLLLIPINWFCAIISGGYIDWAGDRYFSLIYVLSAIIMAVAITKLFNHLTNRNKRYFFLTFILLLILPLATMNAFHWYQLAIQTQPSLGHAQKIAMCIDHNKKKYQLRDGIGAFSDARAVTLLNKSGTTIYFFNQDTLPQFSTGGREISYFRHGPIMHINFAIVDLTSVDKVPLLYPYQLKQKRKLALILPTPQHVIRCLDFDGKVMLWIYQQQINPRNWQRAGDIPHGY